MPETREKAKADLIDTVVRRLDPDVGAFARDFFQRGASEDLVAYTPDELAAFAREAWRDLSTHEVCNCRINNSISNSSMAS